jgi:hypothetical protein
MIYRVKQADVLNVINVADSLRRVSDVTSCWNQRGLTLFLFLKNVALFSLNLKNIVRNL